MDTIHSPLKAILVGIVFVALGVGIGYIVLKDRSASPTPTPTATPVSVEYRNEQYGLSVKLPTSWQGFTTFNDSYTITNVATGAQEGSGVVIKIRHPQWTQAGQREDLPVMVFTHANWDRVLAEQISVGAAPIPPSKLAENSQYVFALPARYNYDYKTGWEEVQAIIDAHSISAFEPASAMVAGPGEHCGGNITTAKTCVSGYHCAPEPGSHLPFGDVGGICIAN